MRTFALLFFASLVFAQIPQQTFEAKDLQDLPVASRFTIKVYRNYEAALKQAVSTTLAFALAIPVTCINVQGARPIASNADETSRKLNSRVEMVLR